MNSILCIAALIIMLCLLLGTTILFYNVNEKIKLAKIELYNSIDFASKETLLDNIVNDAFVTYKINNPNLSMDGSHITQDQIIEIIKIVTTKAFVKITPAVKSNLSLVYNIDKEDQLINIIGEKVSLLVMQFASEVNSSLE